MEHAYYEAAPGRLGDETPLINAALASYPALRLYVEWSWNGHCYASVRVPGNDEMTPEHLSAYGSGATTKAAILALETSIKENS